MNTKLSMAWTLAVLAMVASSGPAMSEESLSTTEQNALRTALDDELHARAIYAGILEDFGQVRPFSNIIRGEENHIAALHRLFEHYGLEVPEDTWSTRAERFDSLEAARTATLAFELENADLYDKLAKGVQQQDVLTVFAALGSASRNHHLPALKGERGGNGGQPGGCGLGNCASNDQGPGMGQGQQHGMMGKGRGMGQGQQHGMMGQGRGMGQGQQHGMMGKGRGMGQGQRHGMMGKGRGMGQGQGRGAR
jgi:hypothetical protein